MDQWIIVSMQHSRSDAAPVTASGPRVQFSILVAGRNPSPGVDLFPGLAAALGLHLQNQWNTSGYYRKQKHPCGGGTFHSHHGQYLSVRF